MTVARPYAEVIGDPIAQSKSPIMHGFWLEKLGIDADYGRSHLATDELPAFIEKRRADPAWRGCNVTLPHKQSVMPLLDRIDPVAEAIGAVNTIVPRDGVLIGHNTDAPGFLEPLRPQLGERHLLRTARILGTGGRRLRRRLPSRGAGRAIVQPHRRRSFHHSWAPAFAALGLVARARGDSGVRIDRPCCCSRLKPPARAARRIWMPQQVRPDVER